MARIIIGLLLLFSGFVFAIKSSWFYEQFGSIAFAEKYLGTSGGTRLFYKLFGILAIFIGFLALTVAKSFLWLLLLCWNRRVCSSWYKRDPKLLHIFMLQTGSMLLNIEILRILMLRKYARC